MDKILKLSKIALLLIPISIGYSIIAELTKLIYLGLPPFFLTINIDDLTRIAITSFPIIFFITIGLLFTNLLSLLLKYRHQGTLGFFIYIGVTLILFSILSYVFDTSIYILVSLIFLIPTISQSLEIPVIKENFLSMTNLFLFLLSIMILGYLSGKTEGRMIDNKERIINITYSDNNKIDTNLTLISHYSKGILVFDENKTKFISNDKIKNIEYVKYLNYDIQYYLYNL